MKKTHQTKTTHHPPYLETGYSLFNPISLYRNYFRGPFPVKTGSNLKLDPRKNPPKLRIIHHTLKPDLIQAFVVLMYSLSSTQLPSTGTAFGAHFRSKTEVTSNLTPVKKPTKTKLRIIHHNLKQDMIQAFVVLMYSSLSSDFKKTHHQFIIQLSVIHQ